MRTAEDSEQDSVPEEMCMSLRAAIVEDHKLSDLADKTAVSL